MKILAIESSCDETGLTLLEFKNPGTAKASFKVLANVLNSQIKIHQKTHGVVPEVAARRHLEMINPLISELLKQSKVKFKDVDLMAVTNGPGLIGSLIVGVEAAKAIAAVYNKPLIGINHLKAHLQANYFNLATGEVRELEYPALGLLVSGGHTQLVLMKSRKDYQIIGDTLDDAVGESFDKVARLMDLPYPGGPAISKLAQGGDYMAYDLPLPLKNRTDFNFSYSGLKTAARTMIQSGKVKSQKQRSDFAASFQETAIDHLLNKTVGAVRRYRAKTLVVAGGVSANKLLREKLTNMIAPGLTVNVPDFQLCTDNALMIAMAAYIEYWNAPKKVMKSDWRKIKVDPGMSI